MHPGLFPGDNDHVGVEATFLYIILASFPLCIDKFLRSKVQNRDFQIYFSHKAYVSNL